MVSLEAKFLLNKHQNYSETWIYKSTSSETFVRLDVGLKGAVMT
jgi:hypothetical protein